jgi:hypothetical protein
VSNRIRLGQRGIYWANLVVGVARRSGVHECGAALRYCGAYARSRGIHSCHRDDSAGIRNAARRSRGFSGPKPHAQAANRGFATWLTLGTDTEPCIRRRRHHGIVEQHVVSVYTVEQWRGSSSFRNWAPQLNE